MVNSMKQKSKLTRSALNLKRHVQMFRCPICQSAMKTVDLRSLVCSQNHTFDIARQGHVNLLRRSNQSNYDKELFTSRRDVITNSHLFNPLTKEITKLMNQHTNGDSELTMIDMGTGEGSHLHNI